MPTGRKPKLTPDIHTAIAQAVRLGTPLPVAAAYAGISKATVLEWIARGEGRHVRAATQSYADFAADIKRAQAIDEVRRIARLEKAAQGGQVLARKTTDILNRQGEVVRRVTEERYTEPQWTADAWFLERSYPARWGRRERVDLRLSIEAAAAKVAGELGLTAQEVLAEATLLLKEMDYDSA